jgi:serine/threonine protein kinase
MTFATTVLVGEIEVAIARTVSRYEFVRVLNKGSCAVICLVRSCPDDVHYACKAVPRAVLAVSGQFEYFERKLQIHQGLRHANIVELVDILDRPDAIFVVIKGYSGADLLELISLRRSLEHFQCLRC